MIGQKVQDAFNEQINAEMYSSYLYLSMSAALEDMDLPGFANWMRIQSQEEWIHAMKFYYHIIERGGRVQLKAIDAPQIDWDSPLAIFEAGYGHEQKVTAMINNLMDIANDNKDHASAMFLQWFVTEQVEEEATADSIIKKLNMIGDAKSGLYMLDKEMGSRTFTAQSSEE